MYEKCGDTRDFCCQQRSTQGISQQRGSEPDLMMLLVNGKAAEHHHRDGVRTVAAQGARCIGVPKSTHCKAVVADDCSASADNISTRRPAGLIASSAPLQPIVKRRLTALESSQNVVLRKRLRRRYHRLAFHGAGAFSNLRSRSFGAGGLSSIA